MKDRKIDKNTLEQFLKCYAKIILDNGMHYTGLVLSVGDELIKIRDKYNNIVFIVINKISSIQEFNDVLDDFFKEEKDAMGNKK